VHGLHQTYHRLRNCFGCIGWYSWVTRVKWKLVSVHLETLLVLVQDRRTVGAKSTIAYEIILDAPMVLLGVEAQMEASFGPFGYSANLDSRWVRGLRRTYHRLKNHFGLTRWNS
jgi:hypothetical protein